MTVEESEVCSDATRNHSAQKHSAASVPPRFCLGAVFVNEKREWKVRSPAALKPS